MNCSIEGCGKPHRAKGLCKRHYAKALTTSRKIPPEDVMEILSKVESKWYWTVMEGEVEVHEDCQGPDCFCWKWRKRSKKVEETTHADATPND